MGRWELPAKREMKKAAFIGVVGAGSAGCEVAAKKGKVIMKKKAREFTAEEHEAMVKVFSARSLRTPDDLLWGLLYETGMRPGELAALRVADLRLKHQLVTVRSKKGSRERVLYMSAGLTGKLAAFMAEAKDEELLTELVFGTKSVKASQRALYKSWTHFKLTTKGLGLDLHLYSFRHSYGSRVYQFFGDVLKVQQLMGHVNIESTLHYVSRVDSARLSEAFSKGDKS